MNRYIFASDWNRRVYRRRIMSIFAASSGGCTVTMFLTGGVLSGYLNPAKPLASQDQESAH
jgi:hypothetical protein